ncbi:hypothetical protein GOBAR_DD04623 [Gossypium barbadense]|nr:hypothetical protein GOBAR_DD04623 [Gossypium barbadense]
MCSKRVAVDARHHMLGRLASILAKELLNGQKIVVVRSEEICMWGGLVSQKMNLMRFLRKRINTKPSHGLIQFPAPLTSFGVPFDGNFWVFYAWDEVKESRMSVLEDDSSQRLSMEWQLSLV